MEALERGGSGTESDHGPDESRDVEAVEQQQEPVGSAERDDTGRGGETASDACEQAGCAAPDEVWGAESAVQDAGGEASNSPEPRDDELAEPAELERAIAALRALKDRVDAA